MDIKKGLVIGALGISALGQGCKPLSVVDKMIVKEEDTHKGRENGLGLDYNIQVTKVANNRIAGTYELEWDAGRLGELRDFDSSIQAFVNNPGDQVKDGDTINGIIIWITEYNREVLAPSVQRVTAPFPMSFNVRIHNVDAPEVVTGRNRAFRRNYPDCDEQAYDQWAMDARNEVIRLIKEADGYIEIKKIIDIDDEGRLVADIDVNGTDLGKHLVNVRITQERFCDTSGNVDDGGDTSDENGIPTDAPVENPPDTAGETDRPGTTDDGGDTSDAPVENPPDAAEETDPAGTTDDGVDTSDAPVE